MNHSTTIREVIEDLAEGYYPEHEYGDTYKQVNRNAIQTALQDITRIVEGALPRGRIISYVNEDGTDRADMKDVRKLLTEWETNLRKVLE